ncbi:collagen alpha-1(I) chain-like isoform X1 [Zonotrichia leucophrys gambelii]|uniref:collagen alpha-1(I) chain-like isoform X1 n=1 Tax=Zonotrichia leucophrys gambelii TaxID=257770 RepID=UPI0031401DA1
MELDRDRDMELGRARDMKLDRERDIELDQERDNDGNWPCGAAGPWAAPGRNRGCCAGSAGAEPGAAMAEPGERRGRAGAPGAAAAGSGGEEAKPGEEEDEEVWEDGDSGHQRLGKPQFQVGDAAFQGEGLVCPTGIWGVRPMEQRG